MAKKEVITLIRRFLKRLFQEGIPIEKAFLYGSFARGEQDEDSDIDVMLVSEAYDENDDGTVGKTWRISSSIDTRIEPYTVGKQRFLTDELTPLLQIVKKEGLEIQA
ncbi:MAG: nucleotidyltransferase domain-containing protein [Candidatus Aminicenantes bacterium]|jgi:predicted nucleotidyltransferase